MLDPLAMAWDADEEHLLALFEVRCEPLATCWVIAETHSHALMLAAEHEGAPLGGEEEDLVADRAEVLVRILTRDQARMLTAQTWVGDDGTMLDAAARDWCPRVVASEAWDDD